jgi:hypothetical protein
VSKTDEAGAERSEPPGPVYGPSPLVNLYRQLWMCRTLLGLLGFDPEVCDRKQLPASTDPVGYDVLTSPASSPGDEMMLTPPFPTAFPTEAVSLVASKLRGNEVPMRDLVNAAWILAGYAAGMALGGAPSFATGEVVSIVDDEHAVKMFESAGQPTFAATGIAIPWAALAQWALTKFATWLLS